MRGSTRSRPHDPISRIVQKLWNYCSILRDDGLSYGDDTEQHTNLLFLRMAYERAQPPDDQAEIVPAEWGWGKLLQKDGDALERQYRRTPEALHGVQIADAVVRLCAINLILHGIRPTRVAEATVPWAVFRELRVSQCPATTSLAIGLTSKVAFATARSADFPRGGPWPAHLRMTASDSFLRIAVSDR